MCGIFGYIGNHTAEPVLVDALRTLEYRGYDSAGIFVPGYGAVKAVGPIDNLAKKITETIPGTSGIAHTRWATHGEPTELNAHPHKGSLGLVWIVHNGIIENYRELKNELRERGVPLETDTDTEVLAKIIESLYSDSLEDAVRMALGSVVGTYGLAVMSANDPDKIVVARMGSPIVLGVGTDGNYVSSDPTALMKYTKDVIYLDDGEMAVITRRSYKISTIEGEKKEKKPERMQWDAEAAKKEGYPHYMIKEIFEAPEVIRNTIRGRLLLEQGKVKLGGLEPVLKQLSELRRLQIVGCGSAYYAGGVGRYILEEYAGIPVEVELGSEYRYKTNHPEKDSAVLAISQSGETADTLASIRAAKEMGLLTLGIVNAVGSTIARDTDAGVYNHAGPEVAVASTKAFISQLTVLAMLSVLIGRERDMAKDTGIEIVNAIHELPDVLAKVLEKADEIKAIAERFATHRDAIFIGRKFHTPIAYEGSLKLKEVAYIHAEAYAGGELKHGPIAMLEENFPVIALAPQDDVYDKMVSNIEEVKARRAPVLAFGTDGDKDLADLVDHFVGVPKVHPIIQPIVTTVPLHLFAYYVGVAKGFNVDRPRNLAKSVTVE